MLQKFYTVFFLLTFLLVSALEAQIDLVGTRYNANSGVTEVVRWDGLTGQVSNVVPTNAPNVAIGASVFDARFGNYYFRSTSAFHEVGFDPDTTRDFNPQFSMQSAEVNMNLGKVYGLNSIISRNGSGTITSTQLNFVEYNIANATENVLGTIPGVSGFLVDGCAYNSNAAVYYFLGIDSTLGMCLYSVPTAVSSFTFGRQPVAAVQTLLNSLEFDNDANKLYSLGATVLGQGNYSNLRIFEIDPATATISLEADLAAYWGFQLSTNTYAQASNAMVFLAVDNQGNSSFLAWDTSNDTLYALQIPGILNEVEADNEEYALSKYLTSNSPSNNFSKREVKIFPNPSAGIVNVVFENPNEWELVRILNHLGQEMLRVENHNKTEIQLDLSSLSAGQYFLQVHGKGAQTMESIVIFNE